MYIGIFSPAPDFKDEIQLWMVLKSEKVREGRQLKANQMTFNLKNNSGPQYELYDYVSVFAKEDISPTRYIHMPNRVMNGLMPKPERCAEIVILPFLAATPTDSVQQFNAAAYCRVSLKKFDKIGLFSFYRVNNRKIQHGLESRRGFEADTTSI